MLLGADTIRPLLNRLVPEVDIVARPRFSKLTYVGPKKADAPAAALAPWSPSPPPRSMPSPS